MHLEFYYNISARFLKGSNITVDTVVITLNIQQDEHIYFSNLKHFFQIFKYQIFAKSQHRTSLFF